MAWLVEAGRPFRIAACWYASSSAFTGTALGPLGSEAGSPHANARWRRELQADPRPTQPARRRRAVIVSFTLAALAAGVTTGVVTGLSGPGGRAQPARAAGDRSSPSSFGPPTSRPTGVVRCDAAGTHLLTRTVAASADGVHLRATFTVPEDLFVEWAAGDGFVPERRGAPGVPVTDVYQLRPGTTHLRCSGTTKLSTLTVVDPSHYRLPPTTLPCADRVSRGTVDLIRPPSGVAGDPTAFLRRYIIGLRVGDVLRRVGYRGSQTATTVVVLRSSRAIAVFHLLDSGVPSGGPSTGRWTYDDVVGFSFCSSAITGIRNSPLG